MVGQGGHDGVDVGPLAPDAMKRPLAVRAFERAGGSWRLLAAAVIGFISFNVGSTWLFAIAGPCGIVHLGSQFGGSGERFAWLVQGCTVPASVQQILLPDFLVMFGYWSMCTAILIGGWWRFEAPPLRRASWVLWLPTVALSFDVLEYFFLTGQLYKDAAGQFALRGHGGVLNWLQMAVSTGKWIAVVAMGTATLMAAAVWFSRRGDSVSRSVAAAAGFDVEKQALSTSDAQRTGICLSGGGIRSAAFCLGVLSRLEAGSASSSQSPTQDARYLAAVSGGAWAATAWTLQKAKRPTGGASADVLAHLRADATTGHPRFKYPLNGRGGIVGAIVWVSVSVLTNLLLVGLLIYLAAWPLGLFMTHCAIDSGQLGSAYCAPPPIPPDFFYGPCIVFAAAGLLWLAGCGLSTGRAARTWPVGVMLVVLSVFLAACLIWIPAWFGSIGDVRVAATVAICVIVVAVTAAFASGVWRLLGDQSVFRGHRLTARWLPLLLGILLLLGAIAWLLVALYIIAKSIPIAVTTPWGTLVVSPTSQLAVAIPAVVLLVLLSILGADFPSLHNLISARLRRTFDPVTAMSVRQDGLTPGTWAWLATKTEVPELILCCAQQRNGISRGGLRAETFTISPHFVRHGGAISCPTSDYIDAARQSGSRYSNRLEYVSDWLATTGAGFSSATGRMRTGCANAALALANSDLGVWLPNPTVLQRRRELDGAAKKVLRRPRFGYTWKKILGWYGAHDRFVFVTDGGHWDNLALVELLRRECDVVYCVDATDDPGSFADLHQALQLAALDLDIAYSDAEVAESLATVSATDGSLPSATATTFTLRDRTSRPVTVHYTKLQAAPGMSAHLKRRAIADPGFPRYPSPSQLLTSEQFDSLVDLGKDAGAALLRCAEGAHNRSTSSVDQDAS